MNLKNLSALALISIISQVAMAQQYTQNLSINTARQAGMDDCMDFYNGNRNVLSVCNVATNVRFIIYKDLERRELSLPNYETYQPLANQLYSMALNQAVTRSCPLSLNLTFSNGQPINVGIDQKSCTR